MKILVRTDFNTEIGSGHLIRCLTLCNLLRKQVEQILFATKTPPGALHSKITTEGFEILQIPPALNEIDDAQFCADHISNKGQGWSLILDHYHLNTTWEQFFYKRHKLMVLDDFGRDHLCDILLDSNFRWPQTNPYLGKLPQQCHLLLGPQYFPLRNDFIVTKQKMTLRDPNLALVCFGGTDPTGETLKFLQQVKTQKLKFVVATPASNKNFTQIQHLPSKPNVKVLIDPPIHEWMSKADLYLGSGGTITWERLYMGLPGLIVTVADNQIENAKSLESAKISKYLGHWNEISYENIEDKLLRELPAEERDQARKNSENLVRPISVEDIQSILI